MKELIQVNVQALFKHYTSTSLISNKRTVFSLFRPPRINDYYIHIENQPELIDKFMQLVNDHLFDEHARTSFKHFTYINAYLLQRNSKSNVFFVKYSETGNTGKNYIDNAFAKLYGEFALTGITEQQLTEKHNGGFANRLYRSYDEFEKSNYKTKSINNIIKRITNDKLSVRSMNADTKQTDDLAIDVLNTNDPACYGILKGDIALRSRLCIIRMKERSMRKSEFADNINVIDDPNFAYSLYQYLMNIDLTEFIAHQEFNRYPIERTDIITKQLNELKNNTLDDFIDSIYDSFIRKKYKKQDVDVILSSELNRLYKNYMPDRRFALTTSLNDELESRGIHYIKRMRYDGEAKPVYYRLHVEPEECEEFDDDEDVIDMNAF